MPAATPPTIMRRLLAIAMSFCEDEVHRAQRKLSYAKPQTGEKTKRSETRGSAQNGPRQGSRRRAPQSMNVAGLFRHVIHEQVLPKSIRRREICLAAANLRDLL